MRRRSRSKVTRDEELFRKELQLINDIEWIRQMAKQMDSLNNSLSEECRIAKLDNYIQETEHKYLMQSLK